jgi:hypothetical protein
MGMLKRLDPLGEEYFYQFIEEARPVTVKKYKGLMWTLLYCSVLFEVCSLVGISTSPSAASHMQAINYVVLAIIAGYGLILLVATVSRILDRGYVLRIWLQLVGIWCMQLSIWAVVTTLLCTQPAADFYFVILIMFLALAVILNIHSIRAEQGKVAKGYYLKDGCGILGVHTARVKKILGPLDGVSAGWLGAAVVGWGLVYSRMRPDGAGNPLWMLIVLPLVPLFLFVVCSPVTVLHFIQIHIYRRFGRETYTRSASGAPQGKRKDGKR